MKGRNSYRIGEAAQLLDVSVDTLRYYEKIKLLSPLSRNSAGVRIFHQRDISRLHFIRRAQAMDFSLAEIAALLQLRDHPARSKSAVLELARAKALEINHRIETLATLRDELLQLVSACPGAGSDCPILTGIEVGTHSEDA